MRASTASSVYETDGSLVFSGGFFCALSRSTVGVVFWRSTSNVSTDQNGVPSARRTDAGRQKETQTRRPAMPGMKLIA